jgi:GAF domain-containing protein
MAPTDHRADTVARLTGLLEVTRLVRSEQDLDALLPAIATAIGEAMGYGTVVISLYRPAWNDFRVETVHGSDEGREALLGRERTWAEWEPLFDLRFERNGCFLLPWDEFDWSWDSAVTFVPDIEMADGPDAWHPEDALFVPLRHSEGHMLGVMSVDEPVSGRRPSDDDLAVLAALAAHAAQAVQDALAAAEAARHRKALEQLLRVSARLTETLSIDAIMQEVCEGIRAALPQRLGRGHRRRRAARRAAGRRGLDARRGLRLSERRRPDAAAAARPRVRGRRLLPAPGPRGVRAAGHRARRL